MTFEEYVFYPAPKAICLSAGFKVGTPIGMIADKLTEDGNPTGAAIMAECEPTIEARIAALVRFADALKAQYFADAGYTFAPPDTHEVKMLSGKWCRIDANSWSQDGTRIVSSSSYCFVALIDFSTKELGQIQAGGIYKPASYKKPAKHCRGTIFAPDFGGALNHYGPEYLR